jgi:hypothetical protein
MRLLIIQTARLYVTNSRKHMAIQVNANIRTGKIVASDFHLQRKLQNLHDNNKENPNNLKAPYNSRTRKPYRWMDCKRKSSVRYVSCWNSGNRMISISVFRTSRREYDVKQKTHTTMPLNCRCGHTGNQSGSENTPEWKVSHSVLIKFMFMYPQGSVEYLYGIFLLDN